jgi:hypothetical protein
MRFLPVEEPRLQDHISKVEYRLPLTIEVIDPDRAKDSRSTVLVEVMTTQGVKTQVECVLSRAFATPNEALSESRNPALLEGRFVGQIPLLLGSPQSITMLPEDGTLPKRRTREKSLFRPIPTLKPHSMMEKINLKPHWRF